MFHGEMENRVVFVVRILQTHVLAGTRIALSARAQLLLIQAQQKLEALFGT